MNRPKTKTSPSYTEKTSSQGMFLYNICLLLGATGVILGAMGAHGVVAERLEVTGYEEQWKTGVFYHLVHILLALLFWQKGKKYSVLLLLAGIIFFSGSLYTLGLTGISRWGAVTPVGGLLLILAWLSALNFRKQPTKGSDS